MCMEHDALRIATSWRAGATVFSARSLDGTEALLWLVPRVDVDALCDPVAPPHREVRYRSMPFTRDEAIDVLPLVPTWWIFEPSCLPATCACGARSLSEILAILPRRLAGQALAAHLDLTEALSVLLTTVPSPAATQGFQPALDALTKDLTPLDTAVPLRVA